MTEKDAIQWLRAIKDKYIHGGDENMDEKRTEALDLAIAALERDRWHNADEPIPDGENIIGWYGGGEYDQLRWFDLVDGTLYEGERLIAWYQLPEQPKEET